MRASCGAVFNTFAIIDLRCCRCCLLLVTARTDLTFIVAAGDDVVFSVGRESLREKRSHFWPLFFFGIFDAPTNDISIGRRFQVSDQPFYPAIYQPMHGWLADPLFLSSRLFNRVYTPYILEIEIRRNRFWRLKWLASIFRWPSREKYAFHFL